MDNILDKIIATKKKEVEALKDLTPINELERKLVNEHQVPRSLANQLKLSPGIIAEFKRASPSKGVINDDVSIDYIISGYDVNGAAAISVLTDYEYFQAKPTDFSKARSLTEKPILRKEFIIDSYQLYQSKVMGADVVLLIAAVLTKTQILEFTTIAQSLGLEVLIELHDECELDKLCGSEHMIGINNRNLKTFSVDINQSIKLKNKLGTNSSTPLISESGLSSIEEIKILLEEGFNGFLIGEQFMRQLDPIDAFKELNSQLHKLSK